MARLGLTQMEVVAWLGKSQTKKWAEEVDLARCIHNPYFRPKVRGDLQSMIVLNQHGQ